jgi:regulator of protease activity HflC (stomatin/prohibitin superfamily)
MIGVLAVAAVFAVLYGAVAQLNRLGKRTAVVLLPHQRGVLFRAGKPVRDLGPGKYRVWAGRELVVHGDVRPISLNYENQVVSLADGFAALYGFSASVQVRDIRKAMYKARDYTQVPAAILLRCTRRQMHLTASSSLKMGKEAVTTRITQAAKARLDAAGFELQSFHVPQLVIGTTQPPNPQTSRGSNSPTA